MNEFLLPVENQHVIVEYEKQDQIFISNNA